MNWFAYLLQVNLYLLLFYGFYALLLRNETFFRMNRVYLISGVVFSFLTPLIGTEWAQSLFITNELRRTSETINSLVFQPVIISSTAEAEKGFTTSQLLILIYTAGVGVFLMKLVLQLIGIKRELKLSRAGRAFSFFNRISVDPLLPANETIMQHEQVHAQQWHSADVLFFELLAVLNWFNPVVYAYKKAIRHIHEFIADEIASEYEGDKSTYAMLLLSNIFGVPSPQLINNFFNQSLLKRRIFMLSKGKSKKIATLKYGLSAPLFIVMLVFSAATVKKNEAGNTIAETAPEITTSTEVKLSDWPSAHQKTKKEPALKAEVPPPSGIPISSSDENNNSISFPAVPEDNTTYEMTSVQVLPKFPGGAAALAKFMGGYIYPSMARENNVSGTVYVSFVVEKDGTLTDIKVERDIGFGTGEEAIRLLKTSPKWTPSTQNGQPVRVAFTQPFKLAIQ